MELQSLKVFRFLWFFILILCIDYGIAEWRYHKRESTETRSRPLKPNWTPSFPGSPFGFGNEEDNRIGEEEDEYISTYKPTLRTSTTPKYFPVRTEPPTPPPTTMKMMPNKWYHKVGNWFKKTYNSIG